VTVRFLPSRLPSPIPDVDAARLGLLGWSNGGSTVLAATNETHPEVASILVTHHLEELPTTTTHALLIADGRTVAAGPARRTVTTENVTAAFAHPVEVRYDEGRWVARTKANRIDV